MSGLLFHEDAYRRAATARVVSISEAGIVLDQTLFYPLGGGQPGDTGVLRWQGETLRITDTKKTEKHQLASAIVHIPEANRPLPAAGTDVEMEIDWEPRYGHMRVHTMLHILSSLVGGDITGGQVYAAKGRIDFNIATDAIDKDTINAKLNEIIAQDHPVTERWITDEELTANPALIKTMSVKPPMGMGRVRLLQIGDAVDLQPCGGTHVKRTGEIGPVQLEKIENKGKQNRRVVVALATNTQAVAA